MEGVQDVAHGAVVDRFRVAVVAVGEDHRVDPVDGAGERGRVGEVSDDDLRGRVKHRRARGGANECAGVVPGTDGGGDDVAADASGCTNDEDGEG